MLSRAKCNLFEAKKGADTGGDDGDDGNDSEESDAEEVAHDSDPDEPLPRVLYGQSLDPEEETPPPSRASTTEFELVDQPVGAFRGLFDDEITVHPKHLLFKMNEDQAKALTDALTSLGNVLAVKRMEADHVKWIGVIMTKWMPNFGGNVMSNTVNLKPCL